jgi:hypothetical protein
MDAADDSCVQCAGQLNLNPAYLQPHRITCAHPIIPGYTRFLLGQHVSLYEF